MATASVLRSINPATDEILGEVPVTSMPQVKAAVDLARQVQPAWRKLGVEGRNKIFEKLYQEISSQRDAIITLIAKEMGFPINQAPRTFDAPLERLRWNMDNAGKALAPQTTFEDAKQLHQIHFEPYGVYAVIAPWNNPLSNFTLTAMQPLFAGNTVVYKMSEEVPLFGKLLSDLIKKAGMPDGVFTQVFGGKDVGEALVQANVDHIHFTGSTAVGEKLYQVAAEKFIPITLELGGSDAGIVFEDADLDRLIESIFWARFINSGQICNSLKRLFVHESRYHELVEKLIAFIKKQKVGNPLQNDTALGPLISKKQRDTLWAQFRDAITRGAKILLDQKGSMPHTGSYFAPVLMTGLTSDMRAYHEELFGPILPITTFKDEGEVIKLANNTDYGLSAYIYTEDRERYQRVASQLQAGSIAHNTVSFFRSFNPFGGYKHSGLGRSNGVIGLQSCCQVKVISMEKA
ncbi:MAG: aldehyde dehydrogenase family protein [Alphaproteobacteria bacterium]